MTTGATGQLGLALPVQGELSGTWGDTVNNGITQYTNIAIAGTLTLTGDGAVTLANTTGDASASNITSTLAGAGTVTAQFAIVKVSGTTTTKVVTAPSYSKTYVVDNASSFAVTFKASGQTGVSVAAAEKVTVVFNGTDYIKLAGTIANAAGSNTQIQFNNGGLFGASANLTWDGTTLSSTQINITGQGTLRLQDTTGGEYVGLRSPASLGASYTLTFPADDGTSGQALITDGSGGLSWSTAASGDVYGPGSSTDNAVARFDSTTGKLLQNSVVIIGDTGDVSGVGTLSATTLTLTNALGTANGGTGLTSFTSGGVVYASSTSALATGSALTFNGSAFSVTGTLTATGQITSQSGNDTSAFKAASATTGYSVAEFVNTAGRTFVGVEGAANTIMTNSTAGATILESFVDKPVQIGVNGTLVTTFTSTSLYTASGINVGFGTSSVSGARLSVVKTGDNSRIAIGDTAANTYSTLLMYGGSGKYNFQLGVQNNVNNAFEITPSTAAGGTTFSTPAFVIDSSSNVGIGTSNPTQKLHVIGSALVGDATNGYMKTWVSSTKGYLESLNSAQNAYRPLSLMGSTIVLENGSGNTLLLDSAGNLGLGVTPSAANLPTIQSTYGLFTGSSQINIQANSYYNSGWKYVGTGVASQYQQDAGYHYWKTAASGTAGNPISFTQAMTLDASGNLGVGTTSPSGWGTTVSVSNTSTDSGFTFQGSTRKWGIGGGYTDGALRFYDYTANSERARITSAGDTGFGTANPPTKVGIYVPNSTGPVLTLGGANGLGNVTGVRIGYGEGGSYCKSAILFENTDGSYATGSLHLCVDSVQDSGNATIADAKLTINSSGYVGIGESSPSQKLVVRDVNKIVDGIGNVFFATTDSQAADKGASLSLGGLYTGSSAYSFAAIAGKKSTSTSSDASGYLAMYTTNTSNTVVERARIDNAGNLLVGTTSTTGSVGNYANVLGGVFRSFSGSVSSPTNTYTTLFAASAGTIASYLVTVWVSADDVGNYQANVIVNTQGGTSTKVTTLVAGSLLGFQMSGYNFQATQNSGGTATINYSAIRIAG